MRTIYRINAVLLALVLAIMIAAPAVFASESTTTAPTTASTTAAPAGPSLSKLKLLGSNNKNYLCSPEFSAATNKYSFSVPDWMEKASFVINGASGLTVTCPGAEFTEKSGEYTGEVQLTKNSQSFDVTIKDKAGAQRVLNLTIYRSKLPCSIESVKIVRNGEVVDAKSGSVKDGLRYEFASGTTSGVTMRIVPRNEEKTFIINLTSVPKEDWDTIKEEDKVQLKLHDTYKRYDYELPLVEGTNIFRVEVTASTETRTADVTVIVGDPEANATQPTTTTTAISNADVTTTTSYTTIPTTAPEKNGGSGLPALVWVLIGVIGTIIIGLIIFAIVNVSGGNNGGGGYDGGYDDGYDYSQPPLRSRRRNLSDYIDDDYYEDGGQPMRRDRNSYDNYSDGRGGYDDYGQNRGRGGYNDYNNRGRGGYDDYDDYNGGGGYRGGY